MDISPILLLKLFLYSFAWGISIGAFYSLNKIFRIFFDIGRFEKSIEYYEKELPLIKKPISKISFFNDKKYLVPVIIFFQDVLISIAYVVGLLLINYSLNNGVFRFYCIPMSLIGFILYYFSIGKLVTKISEWLCYIIKAGMVLIIFIISMPFVHILTKILKKCKNIYIFFKNSIAKQIKKRYNICREEYLIRLAEVAFIDHGNL